MTRLIHLLRPEASADPAAAAPQDILVHVDLDDSGAPVYVRDGRALEPGAVVDLIMETDNVIVW